MTDYARKSLEGLWVGGQEMKNRSTAFYHDIVQFRRDVSDLEVTCRVCNARHFLEMKFGKLPYTITFSPQQL